MSDSTSSKTQFEKEEQRMETPPPSLPPSPPPSLSKSQSYSDWTIEIESLSEEPPPAIQSIDKQTERNEVNLKQHQPLSWSRAFVGSFRRKKSKETGGKDLHVTDAAVQDDLTYQPVEETKEIIAVNKMQPEIQKSPENNVPEKAAGVEKITNSSERTKTQNFRLFGFQSFRRPRSLKNSGSGPYEAKSEKEKTLDATFDTIGHEQVITDDIEKPVGTEDAKTKQTEVKAKVNSKKRFASREIKSKKLEVKTSAKTVNSDQEKASNAKADQKLMEEKETKRTSDERKSPSPSDNYIPETTAANSDESPPIETPVEQSTQVRRKLSDLFKRENSRKTKGGEQASTATEEKAEFVKKEVKIRLSFKRKKTNSTNVEMTTKEMKKNKNPTGSMMFGSSFSLKRIFQNDLMTPEVDGVDATRGNVDNGVTVQNKKLARPKSFQFDGDAGNDVGSHFGSRFISFTRALSKKQHERPKHTETTEAVTSQQNVLVSEGLEEVILNEKEAQSLKLNQPEEKVGKIIPPTMPSSNVLTTSPIQHGTAPDLFVKPLTIKPFV